MSYNWRLGMRVMCVKTHSAGLVKAGQTYTITDIREECKCGALIAVGVRSSIAGQCGNVRCPQCREGRWTPSYPEHAVFAPWLFRPLDELEQTMDRLEKEGCPTSLPEPVLG